MPILEVKKHLVKGNPFQGEEHNENLRIVVVLCCFEGQGLCSFEGQSSFVILSVDLIVWRRWYNASWSLGFQAWKYNPSLLSSSEENVLW